MIDLSADYEPLSLNEILRPCVLRGISVEEWTGSCWTESDIDVNSDVQSDDVLIYRGLVTMKSDKWLEQNLSSRGFDLCAGDIRFVHPVKEDIVIFRRLSDGRDT